VLVRHNIVTKQCEDMSRDFANRVVRRIFGHKKKGNNRRLVATA
jgi:hypothetical protein